LERKKIVAFLFIMPGGKIMDITIRLAKAVDTSDIAELMAHSLEAVYRDVLPEKYIRETKAKYPTHFNFITDENNTHYVIQADNKTIGITAITPPTDDDVDDNCYEIHGVWLHPDYYRQGIGTKAMKFIFEIIRNLGKTVIVVRVLEKNINFIKFYEKCGFTVDGKTGTVDVGEAMNYIRMKRDL
jgi:RimJ/RimL family protein N-acetyltransferase